MNKTLIASIVFLVISTSNCLFGMMGRHKLPSQQYRLPTDKINPEARASAFKSLETPLKPRTLDDGTVVFRTDAFVESPFSNDENRFNKLMTVLMPHFGALSDKDRQCLKESCSYMASHLNETSILREAFVESSFSNNEQKLNQLMEVLKPHLDELKDKEKQQLRLTCRYMASHIADDKLKRVQPWFNGKKSWVNNNDTAGFWDAANYIVACDDTEMLSTLFKQNKAIRDCPDYRYLERLYFGVFKCSWDDQKFGPLNNEIMRYKDYLWFAEYAKNKGSIKCLTYLEKKDPLQLNDFSVTKDYGCTKYGPSTFGPLAKDLYQKDLPEKNNVAPSFASKLISLCTLF
jgi:hypothetical protein